jgi:beta-1,4-mannosyl-glycoprotein beta-1,4-N-acetylglucosaminyltransferase
VEATKTHTGNLKPLFFQENKDRYAAYLDKIIHIVVDDFPKTTDPWVRERFQRDAIARGYKRLSLTPSDWLIISDVDEIPNPQILQNISSIKKGYYSLCQDLYYYTLQHYVCAWYHAKLCTYDVFQDIQSTEKIRMSTPTNGIIQKGGWHLSYFGDATFICNKLSQFAHQEDYVQKANNSQIVIEKLQKGENLFNDEKFTFIPLDENSNLPPNHEFIISRFVGYQ